MKQILDYVAPGLFFIWFVGGLFFAGRTLNLMRLVLNNLKPSEQFWGKGDIKYVAPFRAEFRIQATALDPAMLTDIGKEHQKRAIRNERMMFAWGLIVFVLAVGASLWRDAIGP